MEEQRRLYYQTKEIKSFKTFKWLLKGRWNQGTGNSGDTRTYLEWDELGISYEGSNGVKYGPSYWTVDSYSSSGTLWSARPASEMFDGAWGSESSKSDYKNIDDTNGYVEIIIHTTSGQAIVPNGVGLISCNNQSSYASATPAHFILYGLDESTNEYVQLIDVGASSVNKGNIQTTIVSFEPTVIITTGPYYLLAPSDISIGTGLRWEMPAMELWVDLGSTEYTNSVVSLTGMPSTSDLSYLVFKFDAYYNSGSTYYAADIILRTSTTGLWRSRLHYNMGIGFVGIGDAVTGWTTASGQSVSSKSQDGVSYRLSPLWSRNNYVSLKFIQDRTNYNCYFYINDTLIGYASMNRDLLVCDNIQLMNELNATARVKNVKVAGFANLADAQAWNG